jgi:hypothetical protein
MWVEPVALSASERLLYSVLLSAPSSDDAHADELGGDGGAVVFELLTLHSPRSTAAASGVWRALSSTLRAFTALDDDDASAASPAAAPAPSASPSLFLCVLPSPPSPSPPSPSLLSSALTLPQPRARARRRAHCLGAQ